MEGYMAMAAIITGGEADKLKTAEEVGATCGGTTDGDRCEMGIKLGHCIHEEGMKKKLDYGV